MEITRTLVWALLGVGLMSAEVLSGTFVLLMFGVAALVVAGARLAGLDLLWAELVLFSLVGAAAVLLFRNKLKEAFAARNAYSGDKHEVIVLTAPLAPHGIGQIEYQGTTWTACNESDAALAAGAKVKIVRTEGVKLFVVGKGN